jgi:hypothetical protein
MALYVQVVNGALAQCWDTPPPVPVGTDGWKNAIEIKPELVPYRQGWNGPFYRLELDPAEIYYTVYDFTVDERKGGLTGQNTMQFNQVVAFEAKKETDADPDSHYDPAVVAVAQTRYENIRTQIDAATTQDECDAIQEELNAFVPPQAV